MKPSLCGSWLLLMLLAAGVGNAATDPPDLELPRVDGARVVIDGVLDEPLWFDDVLVIDEFWRFYPEDEGRADAPTEVRVFHDDERIYFAFRCTRPDDKPIRAHVSTREDINRDDQVGIYLDTFDDNRRGFVFYVNALGVQQDLRAGDDTGWNFEWDSRYRSAGRITEEGYVVEVAIPFSSLRFPRGSEQRFGFAVTRKIASRDEKIIFPEMKRGPSMWAQAATLTGIRDVSPGHPVEIIPSLVFSNAWQREMDSGLMVEPHPVGLDNLRRGVTMRWGLSPNISLGLAINPDFSQVESDPDQLAVNTRYALYLEEKRPLFLEGVDVFSAPISPVYTRSIVSPVEGLNINGVEKGWTLGLLHAVDREPAGSLVSERETPGFSDEDLEGKYAVNNVLRVKRDVGKQGAVGMFFADKEISSGLTSSPAAWNRVGGVDAYVPIGQVFRLSGQGLYSNTGQQGGEARHGGAYLVQGHMDDGKGELWFYQGAVSPEYRAETSFMTRVNRIDFGAGGDYRIPVERKVLTEILPWGEAGGMLDNTGRAIEGWAEAGVRWRFGDLSYLVPRGWVSHEDYEGQRFSGGGGGLMFRSSAFDAVRFFVSGWAGNEVNYDPDDLFQGTSWEIEGKILARLFRRLTLDVSVTQHAMYRPDGSPHYDVQLVRSLLLFAFVRNLWLRTVLEVNTYRESVTAEVLLAYVPYPDTAVYLGYSEEQGWDGGGLEAQNRSLFIKAQFQFMP